MKRVVLSLIAIVALSMGHADSPAVRAPAPAKSEAPGYMRISLLLASPGTEPFSCVGHSAIRIEQPSQKSDICFTYENEQAADWASSFVTGRLRMGMFSVPTQEFMAQYRSAGRGVWQYELRLPVEVQQRLWVRLQEQVAAGSVPLKEHIECGCAKSMLDCIVAACEPMKLAGPQVTETQREIFIREMKENHPWALFCLNAIIGIQADTCIVAVTPQSLLEYLQMARLEGRDVLASKGAMLLPQKLWIKSSWFSPMIFAILVLVLTLVAAILRWCPVMKALMFVQFLVGLFFVYLILFAHPPVSGWNWLLVPFNPVIPALALLKKSRFVFLGYALVLVAWVAAFILLPRTRVDPSCLVLCSALAVAYGYSFWASLREKKLVVGS